MVQKFTLCFYVISDNIGSNKRKRTARYHCSSEQYLNEPLYIYTPENFQRGSSTSEVKIFPNPARSQATLYINSIKEEDKGEVVVYNETGKVVQRNPVMPGNNDLNIASFATGMYIVKIFTKDRSVYTQQLVVAK